MDYRVYLKDAEDHFQAAEFFAAKDDLEAEEVALALYDNCSTNFHGVELWSGPLLVMRRSANRVSPTVDVAKIIAERHECVVELEEALERSFECIRRSDQLMATLDKIRAGRSSQDPARRYPHESATPEIASAF